jgi:hypothetical protein
MSYKQAVLRDNPISFWPLDGTSTLRTYATLLLQYKDYQDYLNNESSYNQEIGSVSIQDVSNFGNHGAFTLGSPNFQDVMTIISHSDYDTNVSGCKINSNIGIEIPNFYASELNNDGVFQKGYEQKTFGIEFWLLMPNSLNSTCNIMDLHNGSNTRMQIYVNSDFIYFTLYFSNNLSLTTKKQIYSWDSPIHIFALVKDRVMNIYVNGLIDESITIPTDYQFFDDSSSYFAIGPTLSDGYFTINGLAFYDRLLSSSEINNHMFWAHKDSNPVVYSNQTDVSYFSFDNTTGKTLFSKQFTNSNLYNEGIFSNVITNKTGITLSQTDTATSITGTWIYSLSVAAYENFAGVMLSWDTGAYNDIYYNSATTTRYVKVSVSYDNGVTYSDVSNGKTFPYFLSNFGLSFSANCLIKITLYSSDTSLAIQPRIDNLNIIVYSNISKISDSGLFQFSPGSSVSYIIKEDSSNILSRSKNLGISFFAQDPGSQPGYAIISSIDQSTYQTIEFWFSYNGAGSAVLDSNTGLTDLYIDNSNVLQNSIFGSALYVNGIKRNSAPITLTNEETYHIVIVYPNIKSTNVLINNSSNGTHANSEATYGYISLYPYALTLNQIQSRYLSFISVSTDIVNDGISNQNSIVYSGSSVNSIGTLSEYFGTNSQINNGQPITYHTHIS